MPAAAPKRNHIIDLLRILAASWVVLFHLNQPIKPVDNWYRDFCSYGHLGVPVFFVISGYCILIALRHAKTPTEFITRRFFRIFPPYWYSLIITAAIILALKIITGVNSAIAIPKSVGGLLATLSLTTSPVTHFTTINWVYWTLTFEISFYLIVYLCALLKQYFIHGLIIISVLAIWFPNIKSGPFAFLQLWPLFSLGICVYYLLHEQGNKYLTICLTLATLAGFFVIQLPILYIVCSVVTAFIIMIECLKPMPDNFFSRLGDFSYSLYLIHVPVAIYLLGRLKTDIIQSTLVLNILYDLAILAFMIFLSWLMHKYIELPAISLGKRFGKRGAQS